MQGKYCPEMNSDSLGLNDGFYTVVPNILLYLFSANEQCTIQLISEGLFSLLTKRVVIVFAVPGALEIRAVMRA